LARDLGPDCILERRSSRTVKNWSNDGQQFVTAHVNRKHAQITPIPQIILSDY
jgi:hypothetical protein